MLDLTTAKNLLEFLNSLTVDVVRVTQLEAFGERSSDGGPGLLSAIRRFIQKDVSWAVKDVSPDSITLSRRPEDKPELPPQAAQAWNYVKARWRGYWNGRKLVLPVVADNRLSECWICPLRVDNRCSKCGCYLDRIPDDSLVEPGGPGKALRASEECPIGKWGKV